jgi:putative transposase
MTRVVSDAQFMLDSIERPCYIVIIMKLIIQVKLLATPEQAEALQQTLETANAACSHISGRAWQFRTFRQYDLHKLVYHEVRQVFPLSAQMVVRQIAKVAHAYKLDRETKRVFRSHGSIAYDARILSWRTCEEQTVSIWSTSGRLRIPFVCGARQFALLEKRAGEADLVYRDGVFYLHQVCEVEETEEIEPEGWLGVDLGIVNLATTSDGECFSGEEVERKRVWYERRRAVLQAVGTKSAKRRLKKLAGRFARYQRDVNHCISKALVGAAKRTSQGIALEELKGIRERTRVRRRQRARHHNWAFYQLRMFVSYKGRLAGVPIQPVDSSYTSQTCPLCGHCARANRRSRDWFACAVCGFAGPADYVAAMNIAARADVNPPMVSTEMSKGAQANCDIACDPLDRLGQGQAPSLAAG